MVRAVNGLFGSTFGTPSANRVILSALLPDLPLPKLSTPSTAPENLEITAQFRAALDGFLRGSADRSKYTDEANAQLSEDLLKQTASRLKPFGSVAKIAYVDSRTANGGTTSRYRVTFANGHTFTWFFVLTADGKIAAIGSAE